MVSLKIDGKEVDVERGTTVFQAARANNITIPHFCYHDGLSIPANCRMCLVDIDMGRGGRLMPACYTHVGDGMEVTTRSEKVEGAQESVLEFILLNHPVDCPICDQAGECELQDQYFDYSAKASQLNFRKVHKPKAKVLGPNVILDAERCILCTLCVRFCDEITETYELRITNRGNHSEISTFPGVELTNDYSMCTVDLCPVGALTSRDFRFKGPYWFTQRAQSVCDGCSRGCSTHIDSLRNEVRRMVPRENPHVNQWWACDEGRLNCMDWAANALTQGQVLSSAGAETMPVADAYHQIGTQLQRSLEAEDDRGLGILVHPSWSTEDLFAAGMLAKAAGDSVRIYVGGRTSTGSEDKILIRADKNANRWGSDLVFAAMGISTGTAEDLTADLEQGTLSTLLLLGSQHELSEAAHGALAQVENLVALAAVGGSCLDSAKVVAPVRSYLERSGTFINFQGRIQRFHKTKDADPRILAPWKAIAAVGLSAGFDLNLKSLDGLFDQMAQTVPELGGLKLSDIGPHGVDLTNRNQAAPDPTPDLDSVKAQGAA